MISAAASVRASSRREALADVVGDRERAEPPQLRRDENRRDHPPGPDPEPDPRPAHAGQVVTAERADVGAGADLRRGQHGAADPRADRSPGGEKLLLGGRRGSSPRSTRRGRWRSRRPQRRGGPASRRSSAVPRRSRAGGPERPDEVGRPARSAAATKNP